MTFLAWERLTSSPKWRKSYNEKKNDGINHKGTLQSIFYVCLFLHHQKVFLYQGKALVHILNAKSSSYSILIGFERKVWSNVVENEKKSIKLLSLMYPISPSLSMHNAGWSR